MSIVDRSGYLEALHARLRQFARYSVGRVTGTTAATKGSYIFMREQAESRMWHRAEINVLAAMLVKKGLMTGQEWQTALEAELEQALKDRAKEFPEVKPADDGRSYALDTDGFVERCRKEGWPE